MDTILEYIDRYKDCTLDEMPFNDVDSLVLCQLSYLKFDGIVPSVNVLEDSVVLKDLPQMEGYEKIFADVRYEKPNRALMEGLLASKRFQNLKMNCFIDMIEKEWEMQFSAITFILENGLVYVAFRGTDENMVGWKEDFNMVYLAPVPAQEYSVKYLNTVASRVRCPFIVGGHSKGGNLSIYSAMNCKPQVQEKILQIYSMDGPGFRPETLEAGKYEKISNRVKRILPHSSLFGMIFASDLSYRVIESKSFGIAQHDPYSWVVKEDHFKPVKKIYGSRMQMDQTLNTWLLSLDEQQVRIFGDTLYQVMLASNTDNLIDLTADWKKSVNGIITALKEVDEDSKKVLKEVTRAFFEIAANQMKEEIVSGTKNVLEGTKKLVLRGKKDRPIREN